MATHWKAFLIGWAGCIALLATFPLGVEHADPVIRVISAIGGSLTFLVPALVGAAIGRKTRHGTAAGMKGGAIISVALLAVAMFPRFVS